MFWDVKCMCFLSFGSANTRIKPYFFPPLSCFNKSVVFRQTRSQPQPFRAPTLNLGKKPLGRGQGNLPLYYYSYLTQICTRTSTEKHITLFLSYNVFIELVFCCFCKCKCMVLKPREKKHFQNLMQASSHSSSHCVFFFQTFSQIELRKKCFPVLI